MPAIFQSGDRQRSSADAGGEGRSDDRIEEMVRRAREGFEAHLRTFHERTQLLSEEEVRSQREFVESILRDPESHLPQLEQLVEDYASADAEQRRQATTELHAEGFRRLDEARSANVISQKSYDEWVREWFGNRHLAAYEKTQSLRQSLTEYLRERWELAREREKVLKDTRLQKVASSDLLAEIDFLRNDDEYFHTLSFTQRKNLVDRVRAGLAVMEGGDAYKNLRGIAEKLLKDATAPPEPALHRDKVGTWLRRIFESGASPEEIHIFLEGTGKGSLGGLINIWRTVAVAFWTLRKDQAFQGVKKEFVNTKAFLWMHYDERTAYVDKMRAQRDRALALRARAVARLDRSSHALGTGGRERWLNEYVFNGKYTLSQLDSIMTGNMAERLERKVIVLQRFEEASRQAKKFKGIRGMPMPEKGAFLNMHYANQSTIVREMELRLEHLRVQRDLHGVQASFLRIRNFMDRKDWESALELIVEARKEEDLTLEDEEHLRSMEQFIALRRPQEEGHARRMESTRTEAEQVDRLIESMSPSLQHLCITLCECGSESIGALGWTAYNRDWCNKHGYLDPEREHQAIRKGKAEALAKTRRRRRKGVVSETIQGETGEREYIELSRSAPTNVCVDLVDAGAVHAYAETLYLHRKDHRALYWTNAIFHSGGTLMDLGVQREETRKMYQMRNLLRKLEAKGQIYSHKGKAEDVAVALSSSGSGKVAKVKN